MLLTALTLIYAMLQSPPGRIFGDGGPDFADEPLMKLFHAFGPLFGLAVGAMVVISILRAISGPATPPHKPRSQVRQTTPEPARACGYCGNSLGRGEVTSCPKCGAPA